LALASGLIEITYLSGAKVILQGPVTYKVESKAGGYLSLGKLTARVEKPVVRGQGSGVRSQGSEVSKSQIQNPKSEINQKSEIRNQKLFVVRTPTAVVTDLGTEFGVAVSKDGQTKSHVFRGLVKVQWVATDRKPQGDGQLLKENESVIVAQAGIEDTALVGASVAPTEFIREIPDRSTKTLDLVDVVAGGDGFSGRRNRGIDSTNGQVIGWAVSQLGRFPAGDGQYHRVEAMPFVDGVFVPDGRLEPVQLDSAGHTFGEFVNSTNLVGRYIWAGGKIPSDHPTPPPKINACLGEVDYATPDHGYLALVSNNGITFDLEAIRRANPGCKLVRFLATLGAEKNSVIPAAVWIFTDGRVRFRRRDINDVFSENPVSVTIGPNDRFLTLATLDAGDDILGDDIVFGDPRLEMLSGVPQHDPDLQPK
jgi:hypothetical protein